MKQIKYYIALILFFFSSTSAQPKLSLEKPEIDLGTIYSGVRKHGQIVMRNIGTDTLYIFGVQPTCGCTTVKQPKRYLIPGESDISEIEFNSSGLHGKVERTIYITTNDPTSQNVSVKLAADVREELESVNYSSPILLGNVGIGKTAAKAMFLKNVSNHSIAIKNFIVSSPSMTIEMDKKILNPNDTLNIQATVRSEKIGWVYEHFTIETNSKYQSSVEIKVIYHGFKEDQK
jgi:hypothetical protein